MSEAQATSEPEIGDVIHVSDEAFAEIVEASNVPVLVDFWAPWCGPCKALDPIMKQLASEYGPRAKICKVNIDEATQIAARFGVRGIPNVMLFNQGERQSGSQGVQPKSTYAKQIDGAISSYSSSPTKKDDQMIEMLSDDAFRKSLITSGSIEELKAALTQVPDAAHTPFENGMTPIGAVLRRGQKNRIDLVLATRPTLSVRELAGLGRIDELAVALDADPNRVDEADIDGVTPLFLAARHSQYDACKLLLERGANVAVSSAPHDATPLATAVDSGDIEIVELLLDYKASANDVLRAGEALLHIAARARVTRGEVYSGVIDLLLQRGADRNAKNRDEQTPLQACEQGFERWSTAKHVSESDARRMKNGLNELREKLA